MPTSKAVSGAKARRRWPSSDDQMAKVSRLHTPCPVAEGPARRLLDAGRETFLEHGYHAASVTDIAKRAGTSVGLLYYHFSSKLELYQAVYADYREHQWHHTQQSIKLLRSLGVNDGRALFLAGMHAYMIHSWENRDIVDLIYNRAQPPGFISERTLEDWFTMNAELLQLPDRLKTKLIIKMTVAAMCGALQALVRCRSQEEAEEVTDVSMRFIAHMLSFSPDAAQDVAPDFGAMLRTAARP